MHLSAAEYNRKVTTTGLDQASKMSMRLAITEPFDDVNYRVNIVFCGAFLIADSRLKNGG